ncbi:hypothetical protein [Kamptonema sp. UHCC 0994]|nr:hypothetical protein [Kamptonema sp. UHCC 0994]MDF0552290.1 hypothetical protein [Kamptonema sp. UHCC 0994]
MAETVILPLAMPSAGYAYPTSLESKTRILPLPIKKCPEYW